MMWYNEGFQNSQVSSTYRHLWFWLCNYQHFQHLFLKLAWKLVTCSQSCTVLPSSISGLSVFSFLFFILLSSWCPAFKPILKQLFGSTFGECMCLLFNKNMNLMMHIFSVRCLWSWVASWQMTETVFDPFSYYFHDVFLLLHSWFS